jgi:hypothetical protein
MFRKHSRLVFINDEQTGLHICAKQICDRPSSFVIIEQKACRSYDEQDSSYILYPYCLVLVCSILHMEESNEGSWGGRGLILSVVSKYSHVNSTSRIIKTFGRSNDMVCDDVMKFVSVIHSLKMYKSSNSLMLIRAVGFTHTLNIRIKDGDLQMRRSI